MQQALGAPRNYFYWIGGVLLVFSLVARIISYPVVTSDYTYFLSEWFTTLQTHPGLSAFTSPFSNYAPLYLYFLKLLTFIPIPSLYSIKTLSVIFDVIIAAITYLIIKKTSLKTYSKAELFFVFALMFSVPTVILNSSLWGQSDSVYAAGIVLCLYFILVDKPLPAVLAFSFAFCVKLQAIFFLPVLIGYCLRKESSIGYLLFLPCLYFLSIVPARLGGGSLSALLLVYAKESSQYTSLSVSSQNVFALLGNYPLSAVLQRELFWEGLIVAAACSIGIIALVYFKRNFSSQQMVFVSLLCVLALPYLLPRMHERYFYLADLFSVIYALYVPRAWYVPVLVVGASLLAYMPYLSQVPWFSHIHVDLQIPSLMALLALLLLLFQSYRVVVTAEAPVS
jgi:Gpi18-like mannosyltransferase